MIISLTGFAGSGKNEVAKILEREYGYKTLAFADAIKDMISMLFGWDRQRLEGITPEDRIWRETNDGWWSAKLSMAWSPRVAMQMVGTQLFRNMIHNDIWVYILERRLQEILSNTSNVVIVDCRFLNEIELAHKYGKLYQVKRTDPAWLDSGISAANGDLLAQKELLKRGIHESEWKWLAGTIDGVIDNSGTLEDLNHTVVNLVTGM